MNKEDDFTDEMRHIEKSERGTDDRAGMTT